MRGTDFRVAKNFSAAGAVGAVEDMQERRFTGAGAANDPDHFTGVHGNYLIPSIEAAGLDPAALRAAETQHMNFAEAPGSGAKAWRDIWGAGQGIGAVKAVVPVAKLVERLGAEYQAALARLAQEG